MEVILGQLHLYKDGGVEKLFSRLSLWDVDVLLLCFYLRPVEFGAEVEVIRSGCLVIASQRMHPGLGHSVSKTSCHLLQLQRPNHLC